MRDPQRIDRILEKIRQLWVKVPDWRLSQLLHNVHGMYDPFYLEDDRLAELLDNFYSEYFSTNN